jgi:hypothetical protein
LQEFAHTYLFLECLQRARFVGVDPICSINVVAGGTVSYTKKFYLSIVILRYLLEIKKYYPNYTEYYPGTSCLKTMFSLAGIVAERPEFEESYTAAYLAALKLLKSDNKSFEVVVLQSYEKIRKSRAARFFVSSLHSTARNFTGKRLKSQEERDESVLRNLPFVISDLNRLL